MILLLLLSCIGSSSSNPQSHPTSSTWDPADTADSGAPTDSGDTTPVTADTAISPRGPVVILMIGDGMGFEHIAGASIYETGERGNTTMETAPYQGRLKTASLSGFTDSAASASAMSTGVKTWNGVLGLDGDGNRVDHLVEQARALGMATGILTTDTLTGATPAGFQVHVASRFDATEIASQTVAALPDVLMGGGRTWFEPLIDPAVNLVETADALADAGPALPLVGLFADDTFPWLTDGYTTEPSLADITDAAIDRLESHPRGFFLMVEGARIDHASHRNYTDDVHLETVAFDEAVGRVIDRLESWSDRDVTVLVTADHECGGMKVAESGSAGAIPETTWRWGDHTNADVPIFGWGDRAAVFDGARLDNLWVHAVLESAMTGEELVAPEVPRLADGDTSDLDAVVTVQTRDTVFGLGYNQLDALHLSADDRGLWIGIDGVFDDDANTVIAWIDLDWGQGTGVGADLVLSDPLGTLDELLSTVQPVPELAGLGFDAAVASQDVTQVRYENIYDHAGARLFDPQSGAPDSLAWMHSVVNFDFAKVSTSEAPAAGAASTGATTGGLEAQVPWASLFPDGLPPGGTDIAVWVTLVDDTGTTMSDQALPPYPEDADPAGLPVASVAVIGVDGTGNQTGPPMIQ